MPIMSFGHLLVSTDGRLDCFSFRQWGTKGKAATLLFKSLALMSRYLQESMNCNALQVHIHACGTCKRRKNIVTCPQVACVMKHRFNYRNVKKANERSLTSQLLTSYSMQKYDAHQNDMLKVCK